MTSEVSEMTPISRFVWDAKYRLKSADGTAREANVAETWARLAAAGASVEKSRVRKAWQKRFVDALTDFQFLPAGRIIAGAGADRDVTLFNCFVMGPIGDDLTSIFDNVKEAALTMQKGGGIGHDFSTLRPAGALVRSVGAGASGPVSFMDVWDSMCRTIMSAGQRRGAMMATMRCDHPDIESFIDAKSDARRLRNFNLSVLVTDAFMTAVERDESWALTFEGTVYRTVSARALWDRIMRATYAYAEPGVIFIDRVNAMNNLSYVEEIRATNPCGEQPLPPYGACLLGSINLAALVRDPFAPRARVDEERLAALVPVAVRLLDNMIDLSHYPLEAQRREAKAKRRIGLGITGLGDALAMCGLRYGEPRAIAQAEHWMGQIAARAYAASAEIAAEKGAFPLYDAAAFLAAPNVARLPEEVRQRIAQHGIRNGCLTSVAPTGTISLLAGNVSSGIEPIFDLSYTRRVREAGDSYREEVVEDYAYRLYRRQTGASAPLPATFVTAMALDPAAHLAMQAALQKHVDSAISKTINCPVDMPFDAFESVYRQAYALGLKGCTTYRPNPTTGSVLEVAPTAAPTPAPAAMLPQTAVAAEPAQSATPRGGDVVYMARPLERDPVLPGFTYKLKWQASDHAIYVTMNDIEREGRRRPFEIFINTKNLEHYAWTVALTRMISAVFRRGGDVTFVVEELKAVFDPQGGQWMGGRYVPSLLAAIGEVIEAHMIRIGFLTPATAQHGPKHAIVTQPKAVAADLSGAGGSSDGLAPAAGAAYLRASRRRCPKCQGDHYLPQEGCNVCLDCGYSTCG
jgi:ribonucleoside-diphosphate reductase alpha chain